MAMAHKNRKWKCYKAIYNTYGLDIVNKKKTDKKETDLQIKQTDFNLLSLLDN